MSIEDLLNELFPNQLDRAAFRLIMESEMSVGVEDFFASGGQTHTKKQCKATRKAGGPKGCAIHRPTPHKLSGSKRILRGSTLIEDQCEHGIGHPDPDSAAYLNWRDGYDDKSAGSWFTHGCDGCCFETKDVEN